MWYNIIMSTSTLQRSVGKMLVRAFPEFDNNENLRPDWLRSPNNTVMELDFYIAELKTAFEIQGEQHFRYIEFFHGDEDGFNKRLEYDAEKRRICKENGIRLVEIANVADAIININYLLGLYKTTEIEKIPLCSWLNQAPRPEYQEPEEPEWPEGQDSEPGSWKKLRPRINWGGERLESTLLATIDELSRKKIREIQSCRRRFSNYYKRVHYSKLDTLPSFDFTYLTEDERSAVIDELDWRPQLRKWIRDNIASSPKLAVQKPDNSSQ